MGAMEDIISSGELGNLTGILRNVVTELRDLKQSFHQGRSPFQADSTQLQHVNNNFTPGKTTNASLTTGHLSARSCRRIEPPSSNRNDHSRSSYSPSTYNGNHRIGSLAPVSQGQGYSSLGHHAASREERAIHDSIHVNIPTFTGKEDWNVWISRFEAIAERSGWGEEDRLDRILPLIDEQAAEFLFRQLPGAILGNYRQLVWEMDNRFRRVESSKWFANQFSRRDQRPGETAQEYAADLKELYDKAYGHRDEWVRSENLLGRFLDGLHDEEMKFALEFHKEPKTIDEAVYHASNYMQLKGLGVQQGWKQPGAVQSNGQSGADIERLHIPGDAGGLEVHIIRDEECSLGCGTRVKSDILLKEISKRLSDLEGLDEDKRGSQHMEPPQRNVKCFNCQMFGHFARDCPVKKTQNRQALVYEKQIPSFQHEDLVNPKETKVIGQGIVYIEEKNSEPLKEGKGIDTMPIPNGFHIQDEVERVHAISRTGAQDERASCENYDQAEKFGRLLLGDSCKLQGVDRSSDREQGRSEYHIKEMRFERQQEVVTQRERNDVMSFEVPIGNGLGPTVTGLHEKVADRNDIKIPCFQMGKQDDPETLQSVMDVNISREPNTVDDIPFCEIEEDRIGLMYPEMESIGERLVSPNGALTLGLSSSRSDTKLPVKICYTDMNKYVVGMLGNRGKKTCRMKVDKNDMFEETNAQTRRVLEQLQKLTIREAVEKYPLGRNAQWCSTPKGEADRRAIDQRNDCLQHELTCNVYGI